MRKLLSLFIFFIIFTNSILGQISFKNHSNLLGNQDIHSGFVFAVSDLNGDRLDDILRFDGAKQAIIDYQNADGSFTPSNVGNLTSGDVWSAVIADVDEDGNNDFIVGSFYEPIILVNSLEDRLYEVNPLDGDALFMQGASFSDINNDGAIDYFACDDDAGVSNPYQNDGAGNLFHDPELINTETSDPAFNPGNYSCTWVDYDNDGDSDMYLSKCRLGVADPTDGRRLNRMFQDDGNGNYTDVSEEIGLLPMGQSWATEFGDIDNDGDMDAIIVNHDINTMLFENDGAGNFTDISIEAGIDLPPASFPTGLQTYMYDFDNDTYLDIILTSYNTFPYVYRNNGNQTFTRLSNTDVFGSDINTDTGNDLQSGAVGDFNNDGFLDFMAGFANGLNLPNGATADRLYLNEGNTNGNNYVKVDLKGVLSNLNGIGARIEVNGAWGTLIRDVKSGQGYGIMNSLQSHVGLGTGTEISSIVVRWPSGCITTTNNPDINSTIEIEEGCGALILESEEICEGTSIEIYGIERDSSGVYSETITTNGIDTTYQTTLVVHPIYNTILDPLSVCFGNTIIIDGQEITQSGEYTIDGESQYGCDSISTIDVEILAPIDVAGIIVDDWSYTTAAGSAGAGSITLDMSNVAMPFTIVWSNGVIDSTSIHNLIPADYTAEITDGNGCTEILTFTVDLNTSLSELQEQGVEVYPIPTRESLFINDNNDIASSFELFSIVGKRVLVQQKFSSKTEINTSSLSSGIYILKIKDHTNQLIGTTKIVKE